MTELIGTGSEGLSIGNTSLKWLAETKAHMKRRVIPVKWLPCKRRTKLDFLPVSCKQPLTCLNFKFPGTCDRIVLFLKLRWYCRDGSLTHPLKKIGPGLKLENYQLSAVTDRELRASYMYVRQNFNKIIFKSNYTDLAELQSRTQSLLKLLTCSTKIRAHKGLGTRLAELMFDWVTYYVLNAWTFDSKTSILK